MNFLEKLAIVFFLIILALFFLGMYLSHLPVKTYENLPQEYPDKINYEQINEAKG